MGALVTMEELAADPRSASGCRWCARRCWRVPRRSCATWRRSAGTCCSAPVAVTSATRRCRMQQARARSGCAAVRGPARMHAILGASEHCIAVHASDLCVALVALDTVVDIQGVEGAQRPADPVLCPAGRRPDIENVSQHGELITADRDPAAAGRSAVGLPEGPRPRLVRVRAHLGGRGAADRGRDRTARVALGGVGTIPVAGSRGRGGSDRRPRHRPTFRAAAPAAMRILHRRGHRVQGRARQAHDRPHPAYLSGVRP